MLGKTGLLAILIKERINNHNTKDIIFTRKIVLIFGPSRITTG